MHSQTSPVQNITTQIIGVIYTSKIGDFFLLLLYWVEVRCGIYTGSYNVSNVSYMNSPPPPFTFIPPSPNS
jgi:hypothetical protein